MKQQEFSNHSSRMYTTHGDKKNMGKWYKKDNRPVLAFTIGKDEKVVGYTPIEDVLKLAYSDDLPEFKETINF